MKNVLSKISLGIWLLISWGTLVYLRILHKYFNWKTRERNVFLVKYLLMTPIIAALEHFYSKISPYDISFSNRKEKEWLNKKIY